MIVLICRLGGISMTFGQRLRYARKQKRLTQKELATKINAAHNSISNWENDQNRPDPDTIQALCWALGVTPNYLFSDNAETSSRPTVDPSIFRYDNIEPLPSTVLKPLLGTIACGEPILAQENIEDMIPVPDTVHCDFVLRCRGDSMINARIHDGDIVFIREQPEVENGEIAAVLIENETTLKRVSYFPEKSMLILKPENPAYEDLVYIGQELEHIRILGKAVAFQSLVK